MNRTENLEAIWFHLHKIWTNIFFQNQKPESLRIENNLFYVLLKLSESTSKGKHSSKLKDRKIFSLFRSLPILWIVFKIKVVNLKTTFNTYFRTSAAVTKNKYSTYGSCNPEMNIQGYLSQSFSKLKMYCSKCDNGRGKIIAFLHTHNFIFTFSAFLDYQKSSSYSSIRYSEHKELTKVKKLYFR